MFMQEYEKSLVEYSTGIDWYLKEKHQTKTIKEDQVQHIYNNRSLVRLDFVIRQ